MTNARMRGDAVGPVGLRLERLFGWRPGQRQASLVKLSHASALMFFIGALVDGNTIAVPRIGDPATAIASLIDAQVDWIHALPHQWQELYDQDEWTAFAPRIRTIVHSSGRCDPDLKRRLHLEVGAENVYEFFGSSEGIGVTWTRGDEWEPGCVGKPFLCSVRILDDSSSLLPVGESGFVVFRGPGSRAAVSADGHGSGRWAIGPVAGYVGVGDVGHLDAHGRLFLNGSASERVTIGGTTRWAGEIEDLIAGCDGVSRVAVAEIAVPGRGAALGVVLVGDDTTERAALVARVDAWAQTHLPRSLRPAVIVCVDCLPETAVGKVDRQRVGELVNQSGD